MWQCSGERPMTTRSGFNSMTCPAVSPLARFRNAMPVVSAPDLVSHPADSSVRSRGRLRPEVAPPGAAGAADLDLIELPHQQEQGPLQGACDGHRPRPLRRLQGVRADLQAE